MSDDPAVTDLVNRARNDHKRAWDGQVERYAPLVWSICLRHELSDADAADVNQSVWPQLISQLDKTGDPAALPGWLAAITRRECVRVRRAASGRHGAGYLPDSQAIPDQQAEMAEQEVLAAEHHAALREALARLPPCCQQLIGMLIEDPPVPDAQIGAALTIPAGSIGPRRRRCLDQLRGDPVIAALINTEGRARGHKRPGANHRGSRSDDGTSSPVTGTLG
jgi:RNA polymerase sigma factor (sigma-70 family)